MAATPQAQLEKPELSLIMDELEAGEAAVEEKHGTADHEGTSGDKPCGRDRAVVAPRERSRCTANRPAVRLVDTQQYGRHRFSMRMPPKCSSSRRATLSPLTSERNGSV